MTLSRSTHIFTNALVSFVVVVVFFCGEYSTVHMSHIFFTHLVMDI